MSSPNDASALTFTGERFTPEVRGPIWYEHWHRYAAVAPLCAERRVLDAACGEGYGSFLLARFARTVTGVDVSPDAVAHARARYDHPSLRFVAGSVAALPLAAGSFDIVVSFETIEHLAQQREMLAEFRRVLAADGVLILSSPNRPVYNEDGGVENAFHVRELDRAELKALLDVGFPRQHWYGQRVIAQSVLWADSDENRTRAFTKLTGDRPVEADAPAPPMYFVVVCAAGGVALPALPGVSLFDDGALALWRDYARALGREKALAWDEFDARKVAQDRLVELVAAVNALSSERQAGAARAQRIAELEAELARAQAALATATQNHARSADELAHERVAHGETRARLAYRESARGWMRYPFAAARRRVAASNDR